jgi:hypothetical protein
LLFQEKKIPRTNRRNRSRIPQQNCPGFSDRPGRSLKKSDSQHFFNALDLSPQSTHEKRLSQEAFASCPTESIGDDG